MKLPSSLRCRTTPPQYEQPESYLHHWLRPRLPTWSSCQTSKLITPQWLSNWGTFCSTRLNHTLWLWIPVLRVTSYQSTPLKACRLRERRRPLLCVIYWSGESPCCPAFSAWLWGFQLQINGEHSCLLESRHRIWLYFRRFPSCPQLASTPVFWLIITRQLCQPRLAKVCPQLPLLRSASNSTQVGLQSPQVEVLAKFYQSGES